MYAGAGWVVPGLVDVWGTVGGVRVRACGMRLEVVERGGGDRTRCGEWCAVG